MRAQKVSKTELARRLGLNEKKARRMLDPKHQTKVPTLKRALHALGKRIEPVLVCPLRAENFAGAHLTPLQGA